MAFYKTLHDVSGRLQMSEMAHLILVASCQAGGKVNTPIVYISAPPTHLQPPSFLFSLITHTHTHAHMCTHGWSDHCTRKIKDKLQCSEDRLDKRLKPVVIAQHQHLQKWTDVVFLLQVYLAFICGCNYISGLCVVCSCMFISLSFFKLCCD